MRPMMGPLRIRLQLQTRRKKERPKMISTVLVGPDGAQEIIETAPEKYPLIGLGFKWKSAGLMLGEAPTSQFEGDLVVKEDGALKELLNRAENRKVKLGTINQAEFARMLAKIAHAHAVAESEVIGLSLRFFLPEIILGKSDIYPYYIGGDLDPQMPEPYFHQLRFRHAEFKGRKLYFVTVHLFGSMAMPRYHVVVGEE